MGSRRARKILRFDGVNDLLKERIVPTGSPDALEAIARQTADLTGAHYKDARADADSPYALVIPPTPSFAASEYAPAAIAEAQAERDRVTNAAATAAAADRARKLAKVNQHFADCFDEARTQYYLYHARVKAGDPIGHSRAESAGEIKLLYAIARGFDIALGTYDPKTGYQIGGWTQIGWDKATKELADPNRPFSNDKAADDRAHRAAERRCGVSKT